jgi:hypothetical protein
VAWGTYCHGGVEGCVGEGSEQGKAASLDGRKMGPHGDDDSTTSDVSGVRSELQFVLVDSEFHSEETRGDN